MSRIRIYCPHLLLAVGSQFALPSEVCHRLTQVMRCTALQELELFNGEGIACRAKIIEISKKKIITVQVLSIISVNCESPLTIHLLQAIAKGDRMDWIIQKAVELGVQSITPIIAEHTVVRVDESRWQRKWLHWQGIMIHACEQSGRAVLPVLNHPVSMQDAVLQVNSVGATRLFLEPGAENHDIKSLLQAHLNTAVMVCAIGCEGGWSASEIKLLQNNGFAAIRLGPRILRTETAAITLLGLLQAYAGDLSK